MFPWTKANADTWLLVKLKHFVELMAQFMARRLLIHTDLLLNWCYSFMGTSDPTWPASVRQSGEHIRRADAKSRCCGTIPRFLSYEAWPSLKHKTANHNGGVGTAFSWILQLQLGSGTRRLYQGSSVLSRFTVFPFRVWPEPPDSAVRYTWQHS
jgi:hypothetical protein